MKTEKSNKYYPNIRQALLLLFFLFLLHGVLGIIIAFASPPLSLPVGVITVSLISAFAILFLGVRKTKVPFREVCPLSSFHPMVLIPIILVVVGLGIILSELDNVLRTVLPMPRGVAEVFKDLFGGGIASLLLLSLVAPLTEEFVFLGLILRGFLGNYTVRKAILVSSIIFACYHLNPYQFFSGLFLGLFLSWLFLKTGSLLPCLITHSLFNAQGWIIEHFLHLEIPGYASEVTANAQFQPLWFDLLGILLCGTGILFLTFLRQYKEVLNDS